MPLAAYRLPGLLTHSRWAKGGTKQLTKKSAPALVGPAVLAAGRHLCEPAATPAKGFTPMLGMVVWDVRSSASTRER